MDTPNVHVPHYPTYRSARVFLRLIDGRSRRLLSSMRENIYSQVGTPQETRDWSQPDEWIPTILLGEERELAQHLWHESDALVNPRHLTGLWLLCSSYELIVADGRELLHITSTGQNFVEEPFGDTVRQLD